MPSPAGDNEVHWRQLVGALLVFAAADFVAPALPDYGHQGRMAYLTLITIPLLTLPVVAAAPAYRHPLPTIASGLSAGLLAMAAIRLEMPETIATLAKLIAAICAGLALARLLRGRVQMIAIAVLVSAVDIYSIAGGPTRALVTDNRRGASELALNLRAMDTQVVNQIGLSDLFFFALFTTAVLRFGMRRWTTWTAMTVSFGLSMLLADGFRTPVPALPLLSAAFLLANADLFLPRRSTTP